MNENQTQNSVFTVRTILRAVSILCTIFVFCPTFLVSCSGQEKSVSAMTAVAGVSAYGEKVVEGKPIMLITLIIPILMFVFLIRKTEKHKKMGLFVLVCAIVDVIVWLVFQSRVKKLCSENRFQCKTTIWYFLNFICLLLAILLSLMVFIEKVNLETDLVRIVSGGGMQGSIDQMTSAINQMSNAVTTIAGNVAEGISSNAATKMIKKEDVIGYCMKCGKAISIGDVFCTSCGAEVPESLIAEGNRILEERKALADAANKTNASENDSNIKFCTKCGAKLSAEALFCDKCGNKL